MAAKIEKIFLGNPESPKLMDVNNTSPVCIAFYGRVSTDHENQVKSLQNQVESFFFAKAKHGNWKVVDVYADNGYSGTNFERPQVQKLIELVRANQIDCIIVKDFSRFGRNSIETGYFIERVFPLFHTRFISISDDFDSSKFKGDTGGMDVAFKYLISEYYSRDMSIKTKSAKYAKMQRGEYQSKICPYGYRKSADGRMEPDPEAAAVVQLIFQLAAEGINATAITRELFRRNIPTPGQYKAARGNHTHDISRCHGIWSASTILRILEDERYTGVYVIGKRAVLEVGGTRSRLKDRESWYIIPDHHPAIVEKAVFDTVQASQLRFSQPNKKKRDYPLKGKAFCGCCGHALSRTMQKTSYYYCRHSEADEESRCHKMRLNAAELEQTVFLTLKKQMETAAPLAPDGALRADASVPERTEYEQQIETLQDGKRTLYERYLMGEIDLNTYKAEKAACDELLLKTKNAYAAVLAQAKQKQDEQARQDSRMEASKALFDADTLTTELAELLIDRVLVYPATSALKSHTKSKTFSIEVANMKIAFYCRVDGQSFGFVLPDEADKLREFFAEHQDKPALEKPSSAN